MSERFHRAYVLCVEYSSRKDAHSPDDFRTRRYLHKDGKQDELVPVSVLEADQHVVDMMNGMYTIGIANAEDAEYWLQRLTKRCQAIIEWFSEVQHYLNLDLHLDISEDQLIALIEKYEKEWQYIQLYILPGVRNLNKQFAHQAQKNAEEKKRQRVGKMMRRFH